MPVYGESTKAPGENQKQKNSAKKNGINNENLKSRGAKETDEPRDGNVPHPRRNRRSNDKCLLHIGRDSRVPQMNGIEHASAGDDGRSPQEAEAGGGVTR